MAADHKAQLLTLVRLWIEARPFGLLPVYAPSDDAPPALAPTLAATVTDVEPYRSQTRQAAAFYLAMPKPVGLGLTCTLIEPVVIAPYGPWSASISPLRIRLRWSHTMSDGFTDAAEEIIERVAWEANAWKIVTFQTQAQYTQRLAELARFQEWQRQQKSR